MKDCRKWHLRYLDLARSISTWSKDPSSQVGAVAIGDVGQVVSQGYNGFPREIEDVEERLINREDKYRFTIHAEANVIYNACRNGISLADSLFFVYGQFPCPECSKALIQVGIRKLVFCTGKSNKTNSSSPMVGIDWEEAWKFSAEMFNEAQILYQAYDVEDLQ